MTPQEQINKLTAFLLKDCRARLVLDQWHVPSSLTQTDAVDAIIEIVQQQDKKLKEIRRLTKKSKIV